MSNLKKDKKKIKNFSEREANEILENLENKDLGPDNLKLIKEKASKYWIEKGMAVFHIDYPDLKMRVDQIRKDAKDIKIGDKTERKTFIIGVDVHWIDIDNRSQKARFNTRELKPWNDDKEIRLQSLKN